jgi:hypothetical protein
VDNFEFNGDGPGWALLPQPGPFVARSSDMVRAAIERGEDTGGPNNYETRTRPIWFTNSVSSRRSSTSASTTSIDGSGPPRSRVARRRVATMTGCSEIVFPSGPGRNGGETPAPGLEREARDRCPLGGQLAPSVLLHVATELGS